jgi:type IV pilus assembly protein PilA
MAARTGKNTLVLLIVVAIIAVIILILVPMYRAHKIRQHVATAVQATSAAKLVVMEAATVRGGLDKLKAGDLTYNPRSLTSPYVSKVSIANGGVITLNTQDTGSTPDLVLLLTPTTQTDQNRTSPIAWTCAVLTGDINLAPAHCQNEVPATPTTPVTSR